MRVGVCKLCQLTKPLCDKSHIIPNHAYSPLKGEDNSMIYVDRTTDLNNPPKRQTGEFESGILCQECERRLSRYEEYGKRMVFGNTAAKSQRLIKNIGNRNILEISGNVYDYRKFKLYLLSILWRASISGRKFFENISLSPTDNETLRVMLLNGNPGEVYEYPCLIASPALTVNGRGYDLEDIGKTRSPITYEENGIKYADFLISGIRYIFAISRQEGVANIISVQKDKLLILFLTEEETLSERARIINVIRSWWE